MAHSHCEHHGSAAEAGTARGSDVILPAEIAGIRVPDTELAKAVTGLVGAVSPVPLFNHVTRSFIFGSIFGASKGLAFDPELLFVAAMMHDLGLTDPYIADARFEIDGADAAARILRERGYPEAKIDLVWEAIALHASMEIPMRRAPEVAIVHVGVFMDAGFNADKIPAPVIHEVFEALPRLNSSAHMIEAIGAVLRRKPHTAYLAFEKDIASRTVPGFDPPNFCDRKAPPPFDT